MMNVKCSPSDKTVTGVDVVFKYPVGIAKVRRVYFFAHCSFLYF